VSLEGPREALVYYGYVGLSRLALALPEPLAYGLAHAGGALAARLFPTRREIVAANLARITGATPGSRRLRSNVLAAYRAYARYWLETFRLVRETPTFFLDRFECRGVEGIDRALERGTGAIVVGAHLGNWDAAGAWAAASGRPITAIAEVLRPRRLFDFFVSHRERLGIHIVPAERGAVRKLIRAVESGRIIAIVGDRDLGGRGPRVRFFGETATLPSGPARVALRTGAPLFAMGIYGVRRADGRRGWVGEILEPIEPPPAESPEAVGLLTQEIATRLEGLIAQHPEEWHVFQPFWTADRDAAAR
jgi:phosphatidylinositol dimannoside acyltransferase